MDIGEGRFGRVHLGTVDDREIAIKVLNTTLEGETLADDVFGSFESELRKWMDLSRKEVGGLVRCLAVGTEPSPFIVMEYVDGASLQTLSEQMDLERALRSASSILDTLYFTHHYGVVHADIHPGNVLIGQDDEVLLSDWGTWRVFSRAPGKYPLEMGFKGYLSPEHVDPERWGAIDWRTDIYQVGALLYHLITRRLPYGMPGDPRIFFNQLVPVERFRSDVPEGIRKAIEKALSVDKSDRFRDTTSFKRALGFSVHVEEVIEDDRRSQRSIRDSMNANLCPNCGNFITAENKKLKCKDCGTFFCETCEDWIEKAEEYRGQKVPKRYPLCDDCATKYYEGQKKQIDQRLPQLDKEKKKKEEEANRRLRWYGPVTVDNAKERQKLWSDGTKKPVSVKNTTGIEFIFVPPGEYKMGSESWDNTKPVHKVKIKKAFYLGRYPITQGQWEKVMGKNPSYFRKKQRKGLFKKVNEGLLSNPVESVSWNDVQAFISKLNALEKTAKYCLPTEAEWEYACRAGSSMKYPFGERKSLLGAFAYYKNNSDLTTHPVGELRENLWGFQDILGNVWEWCEDWYDPKYYEGAPEEEPAGPPTGSKKVTRGGSFASGPEDCSCSMRGSDPPDHRGPNIGFRLVMTTE